MLIFQNIMYYWVCYECVKMLKVFGIQPTIRSDISNWSSELDSLFKYFSNTQDDEHKNAAISLLDILLTKTAHSSYFTKLPPFGVRQKFVHIDKPILYLVILTWLRQLQQHFFNLNETDSKRDWNKKFGRYCGTSSANKYKNLGYIHMSKATTDELRLVDSFACFVPSKSSCCITSLLQWAAQILKQDIPDLSKNADDDTKKRLNLAQEPPKFVWSNDDLSKRTEKTQQEEEESSDSITPEKNNTLSEDKINEVAQLSLNDKFKAIATALAASAENKNLGKRKHEDLEKGTCCLLSVINEKNKTKYNNLSDFLAQEEDDEEEDENEDTEEEKEDGKGDRREERKKKG